MESILSTKKKCPFNMDYINFSGPINSLSFGNVTINMLRELHKLDQKTCFFPVGNNLDFDAYDKLSEDCKSWITDSYHNRLKNLNKDNSSLKMWHLMGSESTVGSRSFLYTFYEYPLLVSYLLR